ncbi:putative MFS family arabinose efflux permease [Kribbella sp. VKM Ac-2569]|uniref:YbfB/YjiJ family MFS transporter n=1 Tax=Kribbella sp. VKM Ac-2569 TaxID=2512220 RepID=UPI00102CF6B9|nr:YbfB/YjiJ family MFS transporter [Kribbella sp. VKM Ac-2569]RZT07953.1 putative MFS family arabinose efflux permease [Kribbella sp. VKM Ac-2569]
MKEWRLAGQGAAALAGGMGIGRFAYTPILPMMHTQAGLSPRFGAALATANYTGYLAGALAAVVASRLLHSRWALRLSLLILAATLALMPLSRSGPLWLGLRLIAGIASALVFVIAVSAVLPRLHSHHVGWTFGGVGAGIALSGAVLVGGNWRTAWWIAALLTIACTLPAWHLTGSPAPPAAERGTRSRDFAALLTSYTLEGIGYIIAGTFLVAAINETASGPVGNGAWIVVGVAAVPSTALWARLGRRWSRSTLLLAALVLQAIGIALPTVAHGVAAALISAALFGATFLGVANLAIAIGTELRVPHAVAILTTGYSLGQIVGPLAVGPLLHNGYHRALLVSVGVVALAAAAALLVRHPLRSLT